MAEVLTGLGCLISGEEAVARYAGLRWRDCHRRIELDFGRSFDSEELGTLVDAAIEAHAGEMPAIDGLEAFLDGQAHRRLAVASSSERAWLDTMLGRLGLAGFFCEHVYSAARIPRGQPHRSEEHTSELQSLMRVSYVVFCLQNKKLTNV